MIQFQVRMLCFIAVMLYTQTFIILYIWNLCVNCATIVLFLDGEEFSDDFEDESEDEPVDALENGNTLSFHLHIQLYPYGLVFRID